MLLSLERVNSSQKANSHRNAHIHRTGFKVPSKPVTKGGAPPLLFEDRTTLKRIIQSKRYFWHPSFTGCQYGNSLRKNENYKNEKVYVVPERVVHKEEIMDTKIVYRS